MKLKAHINGHEYDIEQGATFSEELNETLDSGCIIITGVEQMKNLLPFDDVYIHEGLKFGGYYLGDFGEQYIIIDGVEYDRNAFDEQGETNTPFYRHLLVDQFTEEVLRLNDGPTSGIFKYKIELQSETKKLEKIILPNISLTQPLVGEKKSIYKKIDELMELYSPKVRVSTNETAKTWEYRNKYSISEESSDKQHNIYPVKELFDDVYSPDFTLNNPTLKDVISKMMSVKDCIPIIRDDVLYAMDISKRNREVNAIDEEYFNSVTGSRTSDNHADNLRRTYSNALSGENTCKVVECIGFRNSDTPLMTIKNMRLETSMPIYKVSSVKMCYYRKAHIFRACNFNKDNVDHWLPFYQYSKDDIVKIVTDITTYYICIKDTPRSYVIDEYFKKIVTSEEPESEDAYFLCKQEISPLVRLNTERNVLSQDWDKLHSAQNCPKNINEMAQYKFCTVGYDIGSKFITGWGETYEYPNLFWNRQYSTVENILFKVDCFNPYGEADSYKEIKNSQGNIVYTEFISPTNPTSYYDIVSPTSAKEMNSNLVEAPFSNDTLRFKGIFFQIEYQAFYNGTVIHSKDNDRDDITTTDNASDSLTILEMDGVMQKEKANRFGNKNVQITARYGGNELSKVLPLASVYNKNGFENDVVIYHKEYMIWDNCIKAIYYGTKNYVLKNYFVSVMAKYRTWQTMSYSESVYRSENEKNIVLYSRDKLYYEGAEGSLFEHYNNGLEMLCSSFVPHTEEDIKTTLVFDKKTSLNYCYLDCGFDSSSDKKFASDINVFSSGNSILFNMKMFDNYSQGTYISNPEPFIWRYDNEGKIITDKSWIEKGIEWFNTHDDYTGSKQEWCKLSESANATLDKIGFYALHKDDFFGDYDDIKNKNEIDELYTERIFNLPKLNVQSSNAQRVGVEKNIYKDNKDVIDMTLQIENKTLDSGLKFGDWNLKLNDWIDSKHKIDETIEQDDYEMNGIRIYANAASIREDSTFSLIEDSVFPLIVVEIDKNKIEGENAIFEKNKVYNFTNPINIDFGPNAEGVNSTIPTQYKYFIQNISIHSFKLAYNPDDDNVDYNNHTNEIRFVAYGKMYLRALKREGIYYVEDNGKYINFLMQFFIQKDYYHTQYYVNSQGSPNQGNIESLYDAILLSETNIHNKSSYYFVNVEAGNQRDGFSSIEMYHAYGREDGSFEDLYNVSDYGYNLTTGNIESGNFPVRPAGGNFSDEFDISFFDGSFGRSVRCTRKEVSQPSSYQKEYSFVPIYSLLNKNPSSTGSIENSKIKERWSSQHFYEVQRIYPDAEIFSLEGQYYLVEAQNGEYSYGGVNYNLNGSDPYDATKNYYLLVYNTQLGRANLFNGGVPFWKGGSDAGAYTFNLGASVNIAAVKIEQSQSKIPLYHKNMFVVYSTKAIDEVAFQDSYKYNDFLSYVEPNIKVSDVFRFKEGINSAPYIEVSTANAPVGTKSIQYWYLDDISAYTKNLDEYSILKSLDYNAENCYFHFVAGVNITEDDKTAESVKIYLSMLRKKDQRVFDEHHNVIGTSKNYIGYEEDYGRDKKYEDLD